MMHLSHISPRLSPRARSGSVSRLVRRLPAVLSLGLAAAALGCGEDTTAPATSKDPTVPALATTRAATATYTVQDLGTLGGAFSRALAINAGGAVVGQSTVASNQSESHGFLWQDGVMTDLPTLGGSTTQATSINRRGEIAGWSTLGSADTHAVQWTHGVIQDLGTLGGANSWARGINDFGVIVGFSETATGDRHAFVWEDGVMIDIGTLGGTASVANAVNHHGIVVGSSGTAAGESHAFRWQHGVMEDLGALGRQSSAALAINAKGDIVGQLGPHLDAEGGDREIRTPFLLSRRGLTILNQLEHASRASGINQQGVVVGSAEDLRALINQVPWIWQGGTTAPLPELADGDGAALGINQTGDIVGYSWTAAGETHAVMWRRTKAP